MNFKKVYEWRSLSLVVLLMFTYGCSTSKLGVLDQQNFSQPANNSLVTVQSLIDVNYEVISLVMTDTYSLAYYKKTGSFLIAFPIIFIQWK